MDTRDATIRSWGARARAYQRLIDRHQAFTRMAEGLAELLEGADAGPARLVDAAAGTGRVAQTLGERFPGAELFVAEPAEGMREVARERLGERVTGWSSAAAEELEASSFSSDLEEHSVGGVTLGAALHLCDKEQVFEAVARLLRSGGRFATNLWWHSFEGTAGEYTSPPWREEFAAACERAGVTSNLAEAVERSAWSEASLRTASDAAGLELLLVDVGSHELRDTFFVEFAAMEPTLLEHVDAGTRARVIADAWSALDGVSAPPVVRLQFERR